MNQRALCEAPMNVGSWLSKSRKIYNDTDLNFLVKNVFLKNTTALLDKERVINPEILETLDIIESLYAKGMPLAYILGKEEFYGFMFYVDRRALIPRKETERIVEKAVDIIAKTDIKSVLDLCCGCGNIAIAIEKSIEKKIDIFACDISAEALSLALENKMLRASSVKLVGSDLFSAFKANSFDLIVSNPPYVENNEILGGICHEPPIALAAGSDGLDYIRTIIDNGYYYLTSGGRMIIEYGYRHKGKIEHLVEQNPHYCIDEWIKDYSGNWRGVVIRKV